MNRTVSNQPTSSESGKIIVFQRPLFNQRFYIPEKKEHARVRNLMNEVMLAWLKLQWKRDRERHIESMYQLEVNGDSTHMPASVQYWEDDLPAYEGCPTCGYGGEECVIIHFTTVTGETGVMRHQINDFGEFISDLCYVRED